MDIQLSNSVLSSKHRLTIMGRKKQFCQKEKKLFATLEYDLPCRSSLQPFSFLCILINKSRGEKHGKMRHAPIILVITLLKWMQFIDILTGLLLNCIGNRIWTAAHHLLADKGIIHHDLQKAPPRCHTIPHSITSLTSRVFPQTNEDDRHLLSTDKVPGLDTNHLLTLGTYFKS